MLYANLSLRGLLYVPDKVHMFHSVSHCDFYTQKWKVLVPKMTLKFVREYEFQSLSPLKINIRFYLLSHTHRNELGAILTL